MKFAKKLTQLFLVLAILYFAGGVFVSIISIPDPTPEQEQAFLHESDLRLQRVEAMYFEGGGNGY